MEADREEFSQSERIKRLRQAMYSRSLSSKIRTRPREELKEIDYGVPTDFLEQEEKVPGSLVAPRTIRTARQITEWFLMGSIVFFALAVIAFSYYFFFGSGSFSAAPGNVDIAIRGPLTVTSGDPTEFQVIVTNRNNAVLELTDLIVRYPDGTRSPADFLTALPDYRTSLGAIEPGGQRQGTVSAVLLGKEGEHSAIKVELEYRTQNSSAIFVSDATYSFTFGNAPISIAFEGNDEAISGQRVLVNAVVRADAATPLRDVVVEAEYPFGFTVETITPEPTDKKFWVLGDMNPGETKSITIRGTLEGEEGDERIFKMKAGIRAKKDEKKVNPVLAESAHHIAIDQPFIGLTVAVNKESGDDIITVSPGDSVNVVIGWQNNLSTPIANAVLVARLSGIEVPGTSFRTQDGFYRSADKTILFDRTTTRGEFSELKPNARGTVGFSFTMPDKKALEKIQEGELSFTVHAAGKRVGEKNVPETIQSSISKKVKLASNVELIGQGFYYQNPFGSTGPLPPRVDQETTYALLLSVTNTSNTLEQGTLRAQLPPYVRWVGIYSPLQERLTFNVADGSFTWNMGRVVPGVGVGSTAPRQVAVAVGLTPSSSQVGEQPILLRDIIFTAKDTFTNSDIILKGKDITTNLIDDAGFSTTEASVVQ